MAEIWLVRHAETEWSRDGRAHGPHRRPADRRRAASTPRALRERLAGRAFALVLSVAAVARPRDRRARRARDRAAARRPARVGLRRLRGHHDRRDPRAAPGLVPVARRRARAARRPTTSAARADRVIDEALAVDGDVALVAHGHVLRVLAARWVEQPRGFGGRLRARHRRACAVLGFERETRVIHHWNA